MAGEPTDLTLPAVEVDTGRATAAVLEPVEGLVESGAGVVASARTFAGLTLRFRIAGAPLHDALTAAFAHLPAAGDGPADLDLVAWDSAATGLEPPLDDLGVDLPRLTVVDDRGGVEVLPAEPSATVLGPGGRLGYWAGALDTIPVWQRASPFRTALHWWLAGRGWQLVHAAAVSVGDVGLLLAGGSGAGKSTTALRCAAAGLGYAGDDYVVADPETRIVHALYSSGKADLERLRADPHLLPDPLLPTLPADDKAVTYLGRARPEVVRTGFRATGLVVAEVRGRGATTIEPVSRREALRALSVTTLYQLPGDRAGALRRLTRLVSALPCHRLVLGTDHDRIPAVVRGHLEGLAA